MADALLGKCPRCKRAYLGYKCGYCADNWDNEDDTKNPFSDNFGDIFNDIIKNGGDSKYAKK